MDGTTRFGDFLLLKKLSEDPLGETYRAGRTAGNAVEEIFLLRTFSIPGAKTAELTATLHEFESSQKVQAPGLTYPVGGGEVGGVAYVVYDYSTGWDLLQVLALAQSSFVDVERDHALLVVERIAKGLTVLHQTDAPGARPCHGFLVPHNVRMTGEGEVELVGLEVGPYLARLAAAGGMGEARPYLSPQVRSGAAPNAGDDVYSLGAILWRLLLGQAPPADAAAQAAAVAGARLHDGQPLPAGLSELLRSSLAEPPARPAHAGLWHHQLADWMAGEQIRTTHFDLAFFIHELFRRQIQTEKDEIAAEKKLDLGVKAAEPERAELLDAIPRQDFAAPPLPPPAARIPAAEPASDTGFVAPRRSKTPLVAALAAVVLAAVGAGWLLLGRSPSPEPLPVQAAPPPPPPSSSELRIAQEEIERLVRERAQTVGDQLASEYDEDIRSLREQLEKAQETEAEAVRSAAPPSATPAATRSAAPPSAAPPSAATPSAAPPSAAPPSAAPPSAAPPSAAPPPAAPPPTATPLTVTRPAVTPPAATPPPAPAEPTVGESSDAEPPPSAPAAPTPADVAAEAASSPRVTTPPPPAAAPPPPAAPNVTPPQRVSMPKPIFPARARQYRKEATVLIKVLVDADGKVIDAQPVIDKPDPYGFYESAMQAARQAKFQPGSSDGAPVRMWTTVVISFKQ